MDTNMTKKSIQDLQVSEKNKSKHGRQMQDVEAKVVHSFDLNKFPNEEEEVQVNKEPQVNDVDAKVVHAFDLNKTFREEEEFHLNKEMQSVVVEMLKIYLPKYFK